mmetsp:Transcript_3091/g.7657  ORF Transcript_3091/g.7657 Transcript_3091/m.7657 type:complete len:214 (+) Transcript_3091:220-861(+)
MRGRHLLSRPLACGACRRVFPAPLAARWAPISKAPLLAGARARSSVRSLGGDESAGESLPGHVPEWGLPSELKKTKVALHLGYDGSQYKGLQINRESSAGQTVEHFLEQAIYQVGGIRDSNMGDLTKIGWSRASRTDKGVHSLASVPPCSLKGHSQPGHGRPEQRLTRTLLFLCRWWRSRCCAQTGKPPFCRTRKACSLPLPSTGTSHPTSAS